MINDKIESFLMKKFSIPEIIILILTGVLILVSEYYFLFQDQPNKAIFLGLWPPTMLLILIYINQKIQS